MIPFGVKVRDKITGLEGMLTGRALYISGCNQVLVQPPIDKEGKHVDAHWIDDQRIERVGSEEPLTLDNAETPGSDVAAPVR